MLLASGSVGRAFPRPLRTRTEGGGSRTGPSAIPPPRSVGALSGARSAFSAGRSRGPGPEAGRGSPCPGPAGGLVPRAHRRPGSWSRAGALRAGPGDPGAGGGGRGGGRGGAAPGGSRGSRGRSGIRGPQLRPPRGPAEEDLPAREPPSPGPGRARRALLRSLRGSGRRLPAARPQPAASAPRPGRARGRPPSGALSLLPAARPALPPAHRTGLSPDLNALPARPHSQRAWPVTSALRGP